MKPVNPPFLVMSRRHFPILILAFALGSMANLKAQYTWTGTSPGTTTTPDSGNWNTAANWAGGLPVSGSTTELDFFASSSGNNTTGTRYTSTNNFGSAFQLNILALNSVATAVNQTIAGSQELQFVSNGATAPVINDLGTGGFVISAPVDLEGNLTVQGAGSGAVNISGQLTGTGQLILNAAGNPSLTLAGASNSYSGGTVITKGGLITTSAGAIGSGAFSIGGGSKWTISITPQSYSNAISLTGAATIDAQNVATLSNFTSIGSFLLTLRASNVAGVGTISSGIGGTGSISKNDPQGIWILSGANTYSGSTVANQGEFVISGTTSGQGNYTVNTTGTLAGNGSIGLTAGKSLSVAGTSSASAFLAPTNGLGSATSVGTMLVNWSASNASNNVTLGNYSDFAANIGSSGSSTELVVGSSLITGALNISGTFSTLSLTSLSGGFDGSSYSLINYFGALSGTFTTVLLNGSAVSASGFSVNGFTYELDYGFANPSGGSSVELQVAAVPEPSVVALLGIGVMLAAVRERAIRRTCA